MSFMQIGFAATTSTLSEMEAEKIAIDAYIYGYPLITMEYTRRVSTNVRTPEETRAPMGQFANLRTYPDPSFTDVTTPNADTLYSIAWIDLSKEPYVLHVPYESGRYYSMPLLSAWTDVFAAPGTRTTGTFAADFVITGPNWKGELPNGLQEFKSPTNLVWILGRTYCTGTKNDYAAVHKIQDQYSLTPLRQHGRKDYTPALGKVDSSVDMKTPVRDQVNQLDAGSYFKLLAQLLKENPPAAADAPAIEEFAKIGIVPGQDFDINRVDPKIAKAIENAPRLALNRILEKVKTMGEDVNGWHFSLQIGTYGTDYLQRAAVAVAGLGANLPQDAIYPMTGQDLEGNPLDGKNKYMVHFDRDQFPPVRAFWSLTLYNRQLFFVANPLNRYSIGPRNNLKVNPDGSVDLFIQHDSPGKDKESNWLPAPDDQFVLVFRFYWPEPEIIDGSWKVPPVKKVK